MKTPKDIRKENEAAELSARDLSNTPLPVAPPKRGWGRVIIVIFVVLVVLFFSFKMLSGLGSSDDASTPDGPPNTRPQREPSLFGATRDDEYQPFRLVWIMGNKACIEIHGMRYYVEGSGPAATDHFVRVFSADGYAVVNDPGGGQHRITVDRTYAPDLRRSNDSGARGVSGRERDSSDLPGVR